MACGIADSGGNYHIGHTASWTVLIPQQACKAPEQCACHRYIHVRRYRLSYDMLVGLVRVVTTAIHHAKRFPLHLFSNNLLYRFEPKVGARLRGRPLGDVILEYDRLARDRFYRNI
jgi:hypothetical protein